MRPSRHEPFFFFFCCSYFCHLALTLRILLLFNSGYPTSKFLSLLKLCHSKSLSLIGEWSFFFFLNWGTDNSRQRSIENLRWCTFKNISCPFIEHLLWVTSMYEALSKVLIDYICSQMSTWTLMCDSVSLQILQRQTKKDLGIFLLVYISLPPPNPSTFHAELL